MYKELESSLSSSSEDQRKVWAATIIENDINLTDLSNLLKCEQKVATRFLWLISRIGLYKPNKLFIELPFLLDFCGQLNPIYKTSFANFWLIAGLPEENEGEAIDLSFKWLLSTHTNVTIKSRAVFVLLKLTKKYPELKNELKLCLEDQMDKHSNDFKNRVIKVLNTLEK